MSEIRIMVLNKENEIISRETGSDQAVLVYEEAYREGDKIRVEAEKLNTFYWLQMDNAIGRSLVYLTGAVEYEIRGKKMESVRSDIRGRPSCGDRAQSKRVRL